LRDREIYPDVGWQSPSGGSRPVPIGSRSIGVSLQPAIPWRVAPQQSPSPLHRSPILITHLCSGAQSNALLDLTATAQTSPRSHWTGPNIEAMPMRSAPRPRSVISTLRARCHFYLAPTNGSTEVEPCRRASRKRTAVAGDARAGRAPRGQYRPRRDLHKRAGRSGRNMRATVPRAMDVYPRDQSSQPLQTLPGSRT